jgi:hypothetical protein
MAVDELVRHLAILDWSKAAAKHNAEIRLDLTKKGSMRNAFRVLRVVCAKERPVSGPRCV